MKHCDLQPVKYQESYYPYSFYSDVIGNNSNTLLEEPLNCEVAANKNNRTEADTRQDPV